MLSTKISGLAVDTEYNFHLVLKTSAGTYTSPKLVVRTHKMTQLNGITVTPGIMPQARLTSLKETLDRIDAKLIEGVRIDTTHFVTTEGRGRDWEKAVEMNVPVVVPEWVEACEREGRLTGVRGYYLNADPRLRQASAGVPKQGSQEQIPQRPRTPLQSPRTEITPPTPEAPIPGADRSQAASSHTAVEEDEDSSAAAEAPAVTEDEVDSTADDDDHADEESTEDGELEGGAHQDVRAEQEQDLPSAEQGKRGREEAGDFDEVQL